LSKGHDQLRITGRSEIVQDDNLLQEIWDNNPLLRSYLGSIDNPDLIVYRIVPERIRFMRDWSLDDHDVPI
jgi:general stress protein 26